MPEEQWYVLVGQEREGPYTTKELHYMVAQKKVMADSFIWRKGLNNWTRIREVDEFQPAVTEAEEKSEEQVQPKREAPVRKAPASEEPPADEAQESRRREIPFFLRLASIILAIGLLSSGIYWVISQEDAKRAKSSGSLAPKAKLQRLADQIQSADGAEAEAELIKLGGKAVPGMLQLLDGGLGSLDLPVGRVKRIIIAIGPVAIGPLLTFLSEGESEASARVIAVQVLGEIGGPRVVPALIDVLDDPSPEVQAEAVAALSGQGPGPVRAMMKQLADPVSPPSPQARKNLAKALEPNAGPEMESDLRRAEAMEGDPEVKQALGELLSHVQELKAEAQATSGAPSKLETTASGASVGPALSATPGATGSAPPPNINVSVQATAEARVTISEPDKESVRDPEAAREHAEIGNELREQGENEKALEEYQMAYLLNPLQTYYLIILELEEEVPDPGRSEEAEGLEELEGLPPVPVTLEEIHAALAEPEPDLTAYKDAPGMWNGSLVKSTPLGKDAGMDQFLVKGEKPGLDFVASMPERQRSLKDVRPGEEAPVEGNPSGLQGRAG